MSLPKIFQRHISSFAKWLSEDRPWPENEPPEPKLVFITLVYLPELLYVPTYRHAFEEAARTTIRLAAEYGVEVISFKIIPDVLVGEPRRFEILASCRISPSVNSKGRMERLNDEIEVSVPSRILYQELDFTLRVIATAYA